MKFYLISLLFLSFTVFGNVDTLTVNKLVSVYDGDTFRADIEGLHPLIGKNIPIRIRGIDAPEIRGNCDVEKTEAIKSRDKLREILSKAKKVELYDYQRDKFFRILSFVRVDGKDLAELLLELQLVIPYDGGTRISVWCESD